MMLLTAVSMNAQSAQPAADASDKQHSEIADLIQTAGRLVQYGYATKQALPLIQAVQLYQSVGVREETEAKQKTQEGQAVTGDISMTMMNLIVQISKTILVQNF